MSWDVTPDQKVQPVSSNYKVYEMTGFIDTATFGDELSCVRNDRITDTPPFGDESLYLFIFVLDL